MIEVGTVYYEINEYYLGVVLEIKHLKIKKNTGYRDEYQIISLTEGSLKFNKFWTLDRNNPSLKMEFPWKPIS